jgi:hypothetical protein
MDATDNDRPLLLRADDIPLDVIRDIGRSVVETVGEKRSTWRKWNLMAEASRQTMGWRFATMSDREAVIAMVTDAAELASLRLTPPSSRSHQWCSAATMAPRCSDRSTPRSSPPRPSSLPKTGSSNAPATSPAPPSPSRPSRRSPQARY